MQKSFLKLIFVIINQKMKVMKNFLIIITLLLSSCSQQDYVRTHFLSNSQKYWNESVDTSDILFSIGIVGDDYVLQIQNLSESGYDEQGREVQTFTYRSVNHIENNELHITPRKYLNEIGDTLYYKIFYVYSVDVLEEWRSDTTGKNFYLYCEYFKN